jgi:hypothetical protein
MFNVQLLCNCDFVTRPLVPQTLRKLLAVRRARESELPRFDAVASFYVAPC